MHHYTKLATALGCFAVYLAVAATTRHLAEIRFSGANAYHEGVEFDKLETTYDAWALLTRPLADGVRAGAGGFWWFVTVLVWGLNLHVALLKPFRCAEYYSGTRLVAGFLFMHAVALLLNVILTLPVPAGADARAPYEVELVFAFEFGWAFTIFSPRIAYFYFALAWQAENAPFGSRFKQSLYTVLVAMAPAYYATVTASTRTMAFLLALVIAAAAHGVARAVDKALRRREALAAEGDTERLVPKDEPFRVGDEDEEELTPVSSADEEEVEVELAVPVET